jgi:hypothetical protein
MNSTHKPGSDLGIDRGIVAVILLWIAITIVLIVLFALRSSIFTQPTLRRSCSSVLGNASCHQVICDANAVATVDESVAGGCSIWLR